MPEPVRLGAEQPQAAAAQEGRLRKVIAGAALCLGSIALGAGAGAVVGMERPTQTTLAGNEASVDPHIGSKVSDVDLGIIGARIPTKTRLLGVPFAATVRLDATEQYDSRQTPDEEILPQILQTFSDIEHETDKVISDVEWHIIRDIRNGAFAGLAGFVFGLGAYAEHRKARGRMSTAAQTEATLAYKPFWKKVQVAGGALTALSVVSAGLYGGARIATAAGDERVVQASPAFEGTPLEGAEIVGVAAPIVDSAVPLVQRYITENDRFYKELETVFTSAAEEYIRAGSLPDSMNIAPILLVADRHCNIGMDRVIATAAKIFDAQIIASAGDDNFWGSFSFEAACTAGLQERSEAMGIEFVTSLGNHDPHDGNNPAYDQGVIVVDGKTETVKTKKGDVTFLSTHDPRRSEFGHKIVPYSSEEQLVAVTKQGQELGTLACASDVPIDILIAHDMRTALVAAASGCNQVKFTFSGHTHHREGPFAGESGVYHYTEGTTGSAPSEQPSYGPLKTDAYFSVFYYDTDSKKPIGLIHVTTTPDQEVIISDFVPLDDNATAKTLTSTVNHG